MAILQTWSDPRTVFCIHVVGKPLCQSKRTVRAETKSERGEQVEKMDGDNWLGSSEYMVMELGIPYER